ncbi:DUF3987 domain-containing protein [Saccharopolyspora spinosa]|uniref:DUF3987 domain-containing protein n=1 Tax=Saccharopolyspora spinosa TaxID=60894 RepID=UPI0002378A28|nr:DUF3987 domain-containing protein [Saccharopolyspora spinosa]
MPRWALARRARLPAGARLGQLGLTRDAAMLWQRLYVEFGGYSADDGPIEQFLSRAAPNCLRVAGLHAALDGVELITVEHLAAAAAFVRYAVASARAVWIVRDTHVGILAHITPKEFQAKLSASDMAGGTYNRFLPVLVAQTQFLPNSTGADPALLDRLAVDLRARLAAGSRLGQLGLTRGRGRQGQEAGVAAAAR